AEGDDVDAHWAALMSNSAGSNLPSYSYATGPVISTWSSRARHSIRSSPPGSVTVTVWPTRPSRTAATAAAQAAEPQALVRPALPGAQDEVVAGSHVRERNVRALRKDRMGLQ